MNCQQQPGSKYTQFRYSEEEALHVFDIIGKMEEALHTDDEHQQRSAVVQESELNSYIAYLIEVDREEILKQLHLKIYGNNKIEGKILIDLRGQKIPDFIQPEMNIYFSGRIEVEEARARLMMKKLFLEDQPIQPQILDAVILFISKLQNVEMTGLFDWYELPYGIDDIQTKKEQAIFFY